jgi:hypothetical protein
VGRAAVRGRRQGNGRKHHCQRGRRFLKFRRRRCCRCYCSRKRELKKREETKSK